MRVVVVSVLLLALVCSAYSKHNHHNHKSKYNDTFFHWTPFEHGKICNNLTPNTKPVNISMTECQSACQNLYNKNIDCYAISFQVDNSMCSFCDSHMFKNTRYLSVQHSDLRIARPARKNDQKAAVLSPQGCDRQLGSAFNTCNYYARDSDMQQQGLENLMKNACIKEFGHTPDATHVNADSYPYRMCLVPGTAIWTGLTPSAGQRVVASDSFQNTLPQTVSHTFGLNGKFGQSASLATTTTVSFSESVGYSVTIPDIVTEKFSVDLTTSFSSKSTVTHTASNSVGYSSSTTVTVKSNQDLEAKLVVNTSMYRSHFAVPICVSGYFRCQFGSRVNGHYYWYLPIESFATKSQRCVNQAGSMGASVSINSHTTINPV